MIPIILQNIFMIAGFAWLVITALNVMEGEDKNDR